MLRRHDLLSSFEFWLPGTQIRLRVFPKSLAANSFAVAAYACLRMTEEVQFVAAVVAVMVVAVAVAAQIVAGQVVYQLTGMMSMGRTDMAAPERI